MENFKFALFSIVILALLAFIGFWAFSTIESGSGHLGNQELKELTKENKDLKEQVSDLKNEISKIESQIEEQIQAEEKVIETPEPITTKLKYQSLINEMQKLVDGNIYMKRGSLGTRVGTVQKFLNVYNSTSNKIDNDYGPGMETVIKKFQKEQGLISDGEAGPNTFRKMIDWLKKQ